MPPKKRKQTATASAQRAPSPAPEPDAPEALTTETTAASSRSKRSSAMLPPDQPAAKKAKTQKEENITPKRGRGRPREDGSVTPQKAVVSPAKRGRGRPRKDGSITPQKVAAPAAKRGPGRPPKNAKPVVAGDRKSARLSSVSAPDVEIPSVKRRRKGNAATAAPVEDGDEEEAEEKEEEEEEEEADAEEESAPVVRRGRGRPRKNAAPAVASAAPKKVGRPREQPHYHLSHVAVEQQIEDELAESTPNAKSSKRNTGKSKKPIVVAGEGEDEDEDEDDNASNDANITEATTIRADLDFDDDEEDDDEERNYWLMKAEPDSRIEKNANGEEVDVKFTIDDLRTRSEPEPWDGIRNHQAQNNLKAMKIGDLAFFYESNCKKPGVVGIMEIVREASPDVSAFSKDSVYYDPKSLASKPKWMAVHVEFRRKFAEKLPLKELQKFSKPGGALANMGVFKQSRLSVSKVSKAEWDFVLGLVDDDDFEEPAVTAGEDRVDDTADLGTDFAMAFEAPANLGAAEPPPTGTGQSPAAVEDTQSTAAVPAISGTDDSTTGLARAALESSVVPAAPTVEKPAPAGTDAPAVATNDKVSNGLRVKSQARSVSRGRSKKSVSAPPSRTASRAKSASKPNPKAASRTSSNRGQVDHSTQGAASGGRAETIPEETGLGDVDGDAAMLDD